MKIVKRGKGKGLAIKYIEELETEASRVGIPVNYLIRNVLVMSIGTYYTLKKTGYTPHFTTLIAIKALSRALKSFNEKPSLDDIIVYLWKN